MAIREWHITEPSPHVIRLQHGFYSGRASVWLDDALVYRRGVNLVDTGFTHRFKVDDARVTITVATVFLTVFRYECRVDGERIMPTPETRGWSPAVGCLLALLGFAAIAVSLLGVWLFLVSRWAESVSPGGETLSACLAKMPDPHRAEVFTQNGQEYLLLSRTVQVFPRFPSGPPMYVFDRAGRLADWTIDEGDEPSFWERWPGAAGRRVITQDEMNRWPRGDEPKPE